MEIQDIKCGTTDENINELKDNEIIVFGSNLSWIHWAGLAKVSLKWGSKWWKWIGLYWQTYALPTKDENIQTMSLENIEMYTKPFYYFILNHPQFHFLITKVGCWLAGYSIEYIAPIFKRFIHIENCSLPKEFIDNILGKNK